MEPWTPPTSTPNVPNRKPSVFSDKELEVELFKLFLRNRFQPGSKSQTFLALEEIARMKENIYRLIDIYYDALDAPKKGGKRMITCPNISVNMAKKIEFPDVYSIYMHFEFLIFEDFIFSLDHLSSPNIGPNIDIWLSKYTCDGVNTVETYIRKYTFESEKEMSNALNAYTDNKDKANEVIKNTRNNVWKHPCFDDEVRESYLEKWQNLYGQYRKEMSNALKADTENKDRKANEVTNKFLNCYALLNDAMLNWVFEFQVHNSLVLWDLRGN
ncbi:hypothetical protein DKX38_009949 [Salix brachista]|uniref:Uncharacterized protein n=1 Tax=Salix brachista TaxID=2182728 RepID=A0A5N5MC36_9ROSI|nr:hypothetical protein DKX38_009949 [Salix brachista]